MLNEEPSSDDVRAAWDANAEWWDAQIGPDGNVFHRVLVAPAQLRLLAIRPGERVLELACGNGQFAREMAKSGARVFATDFSERFLEIARSHTDQQSAIVYRAVDATDEQQMFALSEPGAFDAAVCTMGIHDIATIAPMMRALRRLLNDSGRFVFSVVHPCFNNASVVFVSETEDIDGDLATSYSVKIRSYLGSRPRRGIGIVDQPEPHWYFDRSLSDLLAPCFEAGFVLDGLEEPAFPATLEPSVRPSSWANYPHIPPVLVVRLRPAS